MTPNDPTLTQAPEEVADASDAAWDAALAAAFGPAATGSHYPATDPEVGTILAGKYRLSERIGEGGMGSVWSAQQSDPVKRKVAVKLIKAGMDTQSVLVRFEAERQALAVMDHPNIAKVYDGGQHEGRPYFVMELVKGVPITEYCDARKLTPRERLELFVPVCQAIQHAHQKGIIHRDIKPSNVLIALYDDKPVPKVIDFGIAKATGGTLTAQTIETAFGGVVGTPQYMSPEQASLNNLDIDTRSDVYSLGVLLYELLTGSPPFSGAELKQKGLLEILRVVREEEPPRPSTKLSTADALPSLSANRGTEPKKLTGLLRNELDWIVMKALEKDRTRRYETANGFAADVSRYLSGEPVLAHPPTLWYRYRKFSQRHRGPILAGYLFLAGVLSFTTLLYSQLERANRAAEAERIAKEDAEKQKGIALRSAEREAEERKIADAAKVEAQAKEAEANAVVKFVEEKVFAAARPEGQEGGLGHEVTLRKAIQAAAPFVETSFQKQPLIEARLRRTLGTTFNYLEEGKSAAFQNEAALALFTKHLGKEHADTLRSAANLAFSYHILGKYAEAQKLNEETLALRKATLGAQHPETLESMIDLSDNLNFLGQHEAALALVQEVLAIRQSKFGPEHFDTLMGVYAVANGHYFLRRYQEASKLYEKILISMKALYPHKKREIVSITNMLANAYSGQGRKAEALELRELTTATEMALLGPEHPGTLGSMNNLANSYAALNRQAEALRLRAEVLEIRKRVLPKDHPDTITSMNNLANSYAALNRHAEALKLREEVLEIRKRVLPKDDPRIAGAIYDIACIHALMIPKAEDRTRQADLAMDWLKQAVDAGYKNAAHMKKAPDLVALHQREDFKKLLEELEAKAEKK